MDFYGEMEDRASMIVGTEAYLEDGCIGTPAAFSAALFAQVRWNYLLWREKKVYQSDTETTYNESRNYIVEED